MKKFIFLSIFCLLPLSSESLKYLRRNGLESLNQNNLEGSIFFFTKALEKKPNDPFSNYNLACVYGILLSRDYCTHQEELPKLYKHLEKAILENPKYKKKMLKDPDLQVVQKELRFYKLAGKNPNVESELQFILQKVNWYSAKGGGVFGPKSGLIFLNKNQFQYWRLEFHNSGEPNKKFYSGIYTLKGNKITLNFLELPKGSKRKNYSAYFKEDKLILDGLEKEFIDDSNPCSI